MPLDTVLALAFIALTIVVLLLRTHVGLSILTALSSYLVVNLNLLDIQNWLRDTFDLPMQSNTDLLIITALTILPALFVLFVLRNSVKGRFFAHIFPAIAFSLLMVTIVASVAHIFRELDYVNSSFLVPNLKANQSWIIIVAFFVAFTDVLSHYRKKDGGRKLKSKK